MRGPHRLLRSHGPAKLRRADHHALWRLVEGAVIDAFNKHPNYLTEAGQRSAVQSVTKRVVGQIVGRIQEPQEGSGMHRCSGCGGILRHVQPGGTTQPAQSDGVHVRQAGRDACAPRVSQPQEVS